MINVEERLRANKAFFESKKNEYCFIVDIPSLPLAHIKHYSNLFPDVMFCRVPFPILNYVSWMFLNQKDLNDFNNWRNVWVKK